MAFTDEQMLSLTMLMVIAAIESLATDQKKLVKYITQEFHKMYPHNKLELVKSLGLTNIIERSLLNINCSWSDIIKCISDIRSNTFNLNHVLINFIKKLPSTFDDAVGYTFLLLFVGPKSLFGSALQDLICEEYLNYDCLDCYGFQAYESEDEDEFEKQMIADENEWKQKDFWESAEGLEIIKNDLEEQVYYYETMYEMFVQECLVDYYYYKIPPQYMSKCDFTLY